MDKETIKNILRSQILELSGSDGIEDNTSLFSSGVIDSINFVEFMVFIEEKFDITYKYFGFQVSDFESLDYLAEFIMKEKSFSSEKE